MCLIALAIDQSARFPLVVASNRDEFFERPTARLGWWTPTPGAPDVLSGRDLQSGGTWLGVTAQGRMAMLTNVRGAAPHEPDAPSRGRIVIDWLAAREPTGDFWTRTALSGHNGFNLIAADFRRGECFWASNIDALPVRQPITHVFERSFNVGGTVAQLRSSSLRNWPPRDGEGGPVEAIEPQVLPGPRPPDAEAEAPLRRSRVRSVRSPSPASVRCKRSACDRG